MTTRAKASKEEEKVEDLTLHNPNDGLYGRTGGPYLDEVEAQAAEINRARVEGRKPDLANPGAYAGIPLQTKRQQIVGYNPTTLAGDEAREGEDFAAPVYDKIPGEVVKSLNTPRDTEGRETTDDENRTPPSTNPDEQVSSGTPTDLGSLGNVGDPVKDEGDKKTEAKK
jgi:hypothetical protein